MSKIVNGVNLISPYKGFPIVEETGVDGWYYGLITEHIEPDMYPDGTEDGDGFVITPNEDIAGIAWEVGTGEIYEICEPDKHRWGVWGVYFERRINTLDDIIYNFHKFLPELQAKYYEIMNKAPNE